MSINSYIRFGISKSGYYFLDFIPKDDIDRYLYRLKFYRVHYKVYKVVSRNQKLNITKQEVCYIIFFQIEKELRDKLKEAYGFIDKREYSIPESKDLICFLMGNQYVIACNKNLSNQIKNYFNQHTGFAYKLFFIDNYAIFMPTICLFDVIFEDINHSIGIANEDNSNEQKKEELLKLRNSIDKYNFECPGIHSTLRNEQIDPVFDAIESGLKDLPDGERLSIHLSSFTDDTVRQQQLQDLSDIAPNKELQYLLMGERCRTQQLTNQGIRYNSCR